MHLSMMSECQERVEQAIGALEKAEELADDLRIRLSIALAMSLLYGMGSPERIGKALDEALRLAEVLGDTDRCMRATWAAWTLRFNTGALAAARDMAEGLLRMATERRDPFQILVGHRLLGNTLHAEGRQAEARRHFERALGTSPAPDASRDSLWHHQDQHALARAMLARVLWVQGYPDQ